MILVHQVARARIQAVLRAGLVALLLAALTILAASCGPDAAQEDSETRRGSTVDLDVLFVGAHPDDESPILSTLGQWDEYEGVRSGVITITRGEGGGNAVGPEEGAELGLIREREERRAVGRAGIENIYNLDKVDFYYTVSAPLTGEIWGHDDTLEKVVRVVRYTRPEVIVTMDPAPTPGNHGNHQYASRLGIEAFYDAANPDAFPGQLNDEGLEPWRAAKLFTTPIIDTPASIFQDTPPVGRECASGFELTQSADNVFGVWSGRASERHDETWAQTELEAQRLYKSQGFAALPDIPDDPSELPCDYFTLVDSRVPFTADNAEPTAMLEGILESAGGGLPLGTEFYLTTDRFDVAGGEPFTVTAHARGGDEPLSGATVELGLPKGWSVEGDGDLGELAQDAESTTSFTVTPPDDAPTDERTRIGATLSSGDMTGETNRAVQAVPAVRGVPQLLPQVEQFRDWAWEASVPQLAGAVKPVLPIGAGEARTVRIDLTNAGENEQSGTVTLDVPEGFAADAESKEYEALAPGAKGSVAFEVSNEDKGLETGMQGGEAGDYDFEISTSGEGSDDSRTAALNLVPATVVEEAVGAPDVDGVGSEGEYGGPSLDLSELWEGEEPESAGDASGSARVVWTVDALYFLVEVTDDKLGTVLPPNDAKRHWRTDSVEILLDPSGGSENTSTTFKVGLFPTTDDPENGDPATAYRDADADQGPAAETAPGMEVASRLGEPYDGYTLEAKIPVSALPAPVDPENMGLNILVYDSDTKDKVGQTRIGWSTWPGVQGDPYRWGDATLAGYETSSEEPVVPGGVTQSEASPRSILQSARDGVPLSGSPTADDLVKVVSGPELSEDGVSLELRASSTGEANVFVWAGEKAVAEETVTLEDGQAREVLLPIDDADRDALTGEVSVLVGFRAQSGAAASLERQLN